MAGLKRRTPLKRTGRLRPTNPKRQARKRAKYKAYLNSAAWKALRLVVIERARGLCERCGLTTKRFDIHHITYRRFGAELPEDLKALCKRCHRAHHGRR